MERVGGEGPPTSGEPYPAERPPISRSARPCILPDVSVIYRSIAIQPDEIVNGPNPSARHSIFALIKVTLEYLPTAPATISSLRTRNNVQHYFTSTYRILDWSRIIEQNSRKKGATP